MKFNSSLFLVLFFFSLNGNALGAPEPMTQEEFDNLFEEISNWGRWGVEDELGTLNTITADKKIEAAKLVLKGISISLELQLNKKADLVNQKPFEHEVFEFGGEEAFEGMDMSGLPQAAGDVFKIDYHGFGHSHMDALPHFALGGKMYNGFAFEPNIPDGFERLGIENIGKEGVFTRGVLIDLPKYFGIDFLEPGESITIEDLNAWEKATGTKIESGDAVFIRTGRWVKVEKDGQWNFIEKAAGVHATVSKWLKDRDVSVIGCDGVSDVMPSGILNKLNPFHELAIVSLGMPIFDNLDLDRLAEVSTQEGRNTFLFVAAPLRVEGATGSPLNPLAIF